MKQTITHGILLSIFAAFSFSIMNVCVKLVGGAIPIYEIIWVRFAVGLILVLFSAFFIKNFSFTIDQPIKFFFRSITSLLSLAFLYAALQKIPLSEAMLLSNTSPLIVPILVFIVTKSKTTKLGVLGIIFGFIGVAISMSLHKDTINIGSIFALISSFFMAFSIIQVRLLAKNTHLIQMLYYYFLMSTIIMTPFGLLGVTIPETHNVAIPLLFVGIIGFIYQYYSTLGYQLAPVRLTAPILYLNVLFGGIFEWLIWDHIPSISFLVGCLVIIIGVYITVCYGTPSENKG